MGLQEVSENRSMNEITLKLKSLRNLSKTRLTFLAIFLTVKRALIKVEFWQFLLIACLINVGLKLLVEQLALILTTERPVQYDFDMDFLNKFMWIVVIVPLLESFFFVIIELYKLVLSRILRKPKRLMTLLPVVIASALVFASTHNQNTFHLIYAVSGGLVYSIFYLLAQLRKESGLLVIYLVHAFWNLLVLLTENF